MKAQVIQMMRDIAALNKSRAERILANQWFKGFKTEQESKQLAVFSGLNFSEVKYWFGVKYHQCEALSSGVEV